MSERQITLEEFKEAWKELELEEAKRGIIAHLISYVIVNVFLILINLLTAPGALWFYWVLLGWGIGLAFHLAFSSRRFVVSEWEKKMALIEMKARKRLEKTSQQ